MPSSGLGVFELPHYLPVNITRSQARVRAFPMIERQVPKPGEQEDLAFRDRTGAGSRHRSPISKRRITVEGIEVRIPVPMNAVPHDAIT